MKPTTLSEFRRELLATGAYATHPDHRAPNRARPGALTTFRLAWNVARVFPMCALYEPLGYLTTDSWAELCFSSVTGAEALGMNVILEGWRNRLDWQGPVVYVCNHMSTYETIMLPSVVLTFGPFSIVAKNSLGHLPFLAKAADHMRMVTVGRKSPREDLLHILGVGCERLAGGESFLIFPQGTRQEVFSSARFSSIGAKLAERAGCPVCPIAVDTRALPTRKSGLLAKVFKDFGPVDTSLDIRCCCGPLIREPKARAMHSASFDWIASKLESWGLPVER